VGYYELMYATQSKEGGGATRSPSSLEKLAGVLENVIVTFIITLLPELIKLGRPPTFEEIYTPILSALLMAMYSYIRLRNLKIEVK